MGQGFPSQRQGINASAGTGLAQTGTIVLSNSNGISFGMQASASSNVITAQVAAVAVAVAGSTLTSGTAILTNSNGISFGIAGQSVSAAYGISAGTAVASGAAGVVFSNSNGLSFGANGATITAALPTVRYWENDYGYDALNGVATVSTGVNLSFQRASMAYALSATRLDLIGNLTLVGSTAGSFTISAAIYTFAGSTASSVSSASQAVTWNSGTNTSAASIYGGQSGTRYRSLGLGTWNITPGEYMIGIMISGSGVVGTTASMTLYGGSGISMNPEPGGGDHNPYFADGVFSAGTSAFPSSIHLTAINQTGASALAQAYLRLAGSG